MEIKLQCEQKRSWALKHLPGDEWNQIKDALKVSYICYIQHVQRLMMRTADSAVISAAGDVSDCPASPRLPTPSGWLWLCESISTHSAQWGGSIRCPRPVLTHIKGCLIHSFIHWCKQMNWKTEDEEGGERETSPIRSWRTELCSSNAAAFEQDHVNELGFRREQDISSDSQAQ